MSDPVLIECTIKRLNGTVVDFSDDNARDGKISYHFKDDGLGRHVAPVANDAHIARFLAIPEAYRLLRDPVAAPVTGTVAAVGALKPAAAPVPAPIAPVAAAITQTAPAPIPGVDDIQPGAGADPVIIPGDEPKADPTDAERLDAARIQYEQVFGQPPRNNVKLETLEAKIAAHAVATAG